jgi:hypothetical protein
MYATVAQLRQYLDQIPEYAQQRVSLVATGGTFTLTYEGQTTGNLDYDATASEVQAALAALSTIGTNKVEVTGPAGGPWEVQLKKDASPLTATNSLTGDETSISIEPSTDALLEAILERATDIVDTSLGFSFEGYSSSEIVIKAPRSKWLLLPNYEAGSLTEVANYDQTRTYTDYDIEADNHRYLYREDAWTDGRYRVTASWGYGDPPPALVEVTLEVAVNIWRSKDKGLFSDVIGVETGPGGGAVGYQGALTNQQKMVIKGIRDRYREQVF